MLKNLPETPGVDAEIEGADGYAKGDKDGDGKVGVDDGVQIVEEETAGPDVVAGSGLEDLFGEGEGAGDGTGVDDNSPDQGRYVEGGEPGASACPIGADNYPEDPCEMDCDDRRGESLGEEIHHRHRIIRVFRSSDIVRGSCCVCRVLICGGEVPCSAEWDANNRYDETVEW